MLFSPSPSPTIHQTPKGAAHRPASKSIETICVGQRVVTQDTDASQDSATAVDSATWKKLVLRADWRWSDGTLDDVNIETLVPPQWLRDNSAIVGAKVPLPLDLIEMGLPEDLQAKVVAIEPCPTIKSGAGRVVLTTVNHLNNNVLELTMATADGRRETIRPTGFHKFYSETRHDWVSAVDLRKGEKLRGVKGPLTVASVVPVLGTHRVYNMTVEHEHVYRVATTGVLVHNMDCRPCPIHGKPQVTKRTPGHAGAAQALAEKEALREGAVSVHLNQKLSTITGGTVDSGLQPDVATVIKGAGPKPTIDIFEIPSTSQKLSELEEKIKTILGLLGEQAGTGQVKPRP